MRIISKAAVAGIAGGLALMGVGVAHAYSEEGQQPVCQRSLNGVHCWQNSVQRYVSDDGELVVKQSKSCSSWERNRQIGPLGNGGNISQGATMNCSNSI